MPKIKERIHNEHFTSVEGPVCQNCKTSSNPNSKNYNPQVTEFYSWFEYVRAKRRLVMRFCAACYTEVTKRLREHADPCGCKFQLLWHGWDKEPEVLKQIEKELNHV